MDDASPVTVTAYLCANGAAQALEFYKAAFGARETFRMAGEDGRIGHAEMAIGGSAIYLSDEWPEMRVLSPQSLGANSVSLVLSVPDAGAAFARAVEAGATVERPLSDQPQGRGGWLVDPYGHRWNIHQPDPNFRPQSTG